MPEELIQFVDSISASATTRLSLSSAPWRVLHQGTDVNPPAMRRSVTSTLLADGSQIPAAAYENRVIRLHVLLTADSHTLAITQLQTLHRELNRTTNFLRWQPEPSIPAVYFRTFRAPDYALSSDYGTGKGGVHELTLEIPAEPFALGLREDIAAATVNNDPASGSNGKFVDLTGIKGDVEVPLIISIPSSAVKARSSVFAVRRRGTPSSMPYVQQAESMTLGTDTTVRANSATYSGSSGNSLITSFSTTTSLATRASVMWPPSASVDARGTYRVFGRFDTDTSDTGEYTIRLRIGERLIDNVAVALTSVFSSPSMVDLGLVQIPVGMDPETDGLSGTPVTVGAARTKIEYRARRDAGTGTLILDYLLFVPADDRLCIVTWGDQVAGTVTTSVLDGTKGVVYSKDSSGYLDDTTAAFFVGDVPMVTPNVTNRLCFIRDVTINPGSADSVGSSAALTISYYPRYLSVRPTST